jgi:tetraacyldisaccharide 4'-kinase
VYVRQFRDHYRYDSIDLDSIRQTYENLGERNKAIVITEKDAARLEPFRHWFLQNKMRIFVQPVAVKFLNDDGQQFNNDITTYIEFTNAKIAR